MEAPVAHENEASPIEAAIEYVTYLQEATTSLTDRFNKVTKILYEAYQNGNEDAGEQLARVLGTVSVLGQEATSKVELFERYVNF
jgi:hypothetical protein